MVGIVQSGRFAVVSPGFAVLQSCVGWWDPATYSGSGNLLNKGTGAAVLDLTINSATFSVDHFTIAAGNSLTCASNALVDFGTNVPFHVGVIAKFTATPLTFGGLISKDPGGASGWAVSTNGTTVTSLLQVVQRPGPVVGNSNASSAGSVGTKAILSASRSASPTLVTYLNSTAASPVSTNAGVDTTNSGQLAIGKGANTANQAFELYGAFVSATVLSTQNLADIQAYYGF